METIVVYVHTLTLALIVKQQTISAQVDHVSTAVLVNQMPNLPATHVYAHSATLEFDVNRPLTFVSRTHVLTMVYVTPYLMATHVLVLPDSQV